LYHNTNIPPGGHFCLHLQADQFNIDWGIPSLVLSSLDFDHISLSVTNFNVVAQLQIPTRNITRLWPI